MYVRRRYVRAIIMWSHESRGCQSWQSVGTRMSDDRAAKIFRRRSPSLAFSLYLSPRVAFLFLLSTCWHCTLLRVYTHIHIHAAVVATLRSVPANTHGFLGVHEVFLSLDFPPGIITSRSTRIRDYSLASPLPEETEQKACVGTHVRGRNIFNRQMPSCPADWNHRRG